jgi:putative Ca2+/H+ antiporter (TMEM165/GDT1 family)
MVMSMSARSKSPQMVFFGAAAALVMSSLVAVLLGDVVLKAIPIKFVRMGTGVAFLGMGTILVLRSVR